MTFSRLNLLGVNVLAALFIMSACSDDPPTKPPPPPPIDSGVVVDVIGEPLEPVPEVRFDRPVDFAAALPRRRLFVNVDNESFIVDTATATNIGSVPGRVTGIAVLEEGVLLAGAQGFFVVEDDGNVLRSPLTDSFAGGAVTQILTAQGAIWIATTTGLHRITGPEQVAFEPMGLPAENASLTFGPPVDGQPALWVAAASALYGIVINGDSAIAYPEPIDAPIVAMTSDRTGRLWVIIDGMLSSRATDGSWRVHEIEAPSQLSRSPIGDVVWIGAAEGIWRHSDDEFRLLMDTAGRSILTGLPDDSVLSQDGNLAQLHSEARVNVVGIEDGALLSETTEVEFRPLLEERVDALTATLDGTALSVVDRRVTLSPEGLEDGTHELVVRATYTDGRADIETTLRFSVFAGEPPAWSTDVEPLFNQSCALCHGVQGSARRLNTKALWVEQFDAIIDNVRNDRMPLPPVSPLETNEVEIIEGWQAAGFLD